jgi:hypothetical protein
MRFNAFLKFSLLFTGILLFFSILFAGQQERTDTQLRMMIDKYVSDAIDFELMRHELFDWHYRVWDRRSSYRYGRQFDSLISSYLFFNALEQSRNYEELIRNYENLLFRSLENYEKPTESTYSLYSDSNEYLGKVYINKTGSNINLIHFFPHSMSLLSKAISALASAYKNETTGFYRKGIVKIRIFGGREEFELILDGTKAPELRQVLRDKK